MAHQHIMIGMIVALACLPSPAQAANEEYPLPFFVDDFGDGDATDGSPVSWEPWPNSLQANLEVIDGDFILTPASGFDETGNRPASAFVSAGSYADVSIRAIFGAMEPGGHWLGVLARGGQGEDGDYTGGVVAAISSNGELVLFSEEADSTFTILDRVGVDIDPTLGDFNFRFEVFDATMTATVWTVDAEKPSMPQATATIPNQYLNNDIIGLSSTSFDDIEGPSHTIARFAALPSLYAPLVPGDFDDNQVVDDIDITALSREVAGGGSDLLYDVDFDGNVDADDRTYWVTQIKHTWFGDTNLDGVFTGNDLIFVLAAGQFEDNTAGNSTWATGDWDGDSEFTSADLVVALADGGFEKGPRAAAAAVPEPASAVLMCIGLVAIRFGTARSVPSCGSDY